jgi:uncharacterized glyoxalase superfamily protein PhnB
MADALPSYPTISPYLFYEDTAAALEWLARVFGLKERMRATDEQGALQHAEMELGGSVVMMGSPPDYRNPRKLGQVTVGLYVYVDDVDAHFERAKAEGAEIESPPEDKPYGDRSYGVFDPEGHQWWFAQHMG